MASNVIASLQSAHIVVITMATQSDKKTLKHHDTDCVYVTDINRMTTTAETIRFMIALYTTRTTVPIRP